MVSEVVDQRLIVFAGEKSAFVFSGRAGLLQLETALVDSSYRAEFVDRGVYAEILA